MSDILYEFKQFPISFPDSKKKFRGVEVQNALTVAAGGMIFAHNKILLVKADSADMWSIPGGIVKFDVSPESTVTGHIRDELGLKVSVLKAYPFIFNMSIESVTYHEFIFLLHFLVKIEDRRKIVIGGDIVDYKWESIGSNFRDCYPNVKPAVDYFMQI